MENIVKDSKDHLVNTKGQYQINDQFQIKYHINTMVCILYALLEISELSCAKEIFNINEKICWINFDDVIKPVLLNNVIVKAISGVW